MKPSIIGLLFGGSSARAFVFATCGELGGFSDMPRLAKYCRCEVDMPDCGLELWNVGGIAGKDHVKNCVRLIFGKHGQDKDFHIDIRYTWWDRYVTKRSFEDKIAQVVGKLAIRLSEENKMKLANRTFRATNL